MKKFFFLFLILMPSLLFCQNLTGTWEGSGGGTTFIRLVVKHRGDSLYGYTYDEGGGYCKATFLGSWNKSKKRVIGYGGRMIENSGTHVLTDYDWTYSQEEGGEFLKENIHNLFQSILGSPDRQYLRKISDKIAPPKPKEVGPDSEEVVKKAVPLAKAPVPITKAPLPVKKSPPQATTTAPTSAAKTRVPVKTTTAPIAKTPVSTPPVANKKPEVSAKPAVPVTKVPAPIAKTASPVSVPAPVSVTAKQAPEPLLKIKNERATKLVETIVTDADSIKMYVYDNGEVDGDTVTIFINNVLVLDRYRISEKAKEITVALKGNGQQTIELFANNLGSIPPNTALIIIIAGKERFELRASYDLSTNAKIVIRKRE